MTTPKTLRARDGGEFSVAIWPATQDIQVTDSYVSAIQEEILRPGGQGLFSLDQDDLLERKAMLFGLFVERHGRRDFAAGLHAVVDGGGTHWLQGAVVEPEFRGGGLLKPLAAIARVEGVLKGAKATSCVVRVYPDDSVNKPSLFSFIAIGLRPQSEKGRTKLKGDRHDRHLFATAEPDGTIRYEMLTGDERTLASAHAEIDRWSEKQ